MIYKYNAAVFQGAQGYMAVFPALDDLSVTALNMDELKEQVSQDVQAFLFARKVEGAAIPVNTEFTAQSVIDRLGLPYPYGTVETFTIDA